MSASDGDAAERLVARETLIRLANSCDRAAARGAVVTPFAADLNAEDYRSIAGILRRLIVSPD